MDVLKRLIRTECLLFCYAICYHHLAAGQEMEMTDEIRRVLDNLGPGPEGVVPSTPAPENVNCYVEMPSTIRVGGSCLRFGRSNMYACQSGMYVQLSTDCERLLNRPNNRISRQQRRRSRRARRRDQS